MGRVIGSLRWENEFGESERCSPTEVMTPYVEWHPRHVYTISYSGRNAPGELAVNIAATPT